MPVIQRADFGRMSCCTLTYTSDNKKRGFAKTANPLFAYRGNLVCGSKSCQAKLVDESLVCRYVHILDAAVEDEADGVSPRRKAHLP